MGPGASATPRDCELAEELGRRSAEHDWIALTGGVNQGVMHAALRGAKRVGGTTIGVLSDENQDRMSEYVDIPIVTGLRSARNNVNALTPAVVVAVGMNEGTASEVALAMQAGKPVVLVQSRMNHLDGVVAEFFRLLNEQRPASKKSALHVVQDVDAAIDVLQHFLRGV